MSVEYGFEVLWTETGAQCLQDQLSDSGMSAVAFLEGLAMQYMGFSLSGTVLLAAGEIEPYDPEHGYQYPSMSSIAFLYGGMAAVHVASCLLTTEQRMQMAAVDVGIDRTNDFLDHNRRSAAERQEEIASQIVAFSNSGWVRASASFEPFFAQWDDVACPDVLHRPLLRSGFGFVVQLANLAEENQHSESLKKLAARSESGAIDWDMLLQEAE